MSNCTPHCNLLEQSEVLPNACELCASGVAAGVALSFQKEKDSDKASDRQMNVIGKPQSCLLSA